MRRRLAALSALLLFAASAVVAVDTSLRAFPRGLVAVMLAGSSAVAAWEAVRRVGPARTLLAVLGVVLAAGSVVVLIGGRAFGGLVLAVALLGLAAVAGRGAFRMHVALPAAPRPVHPVVVWNPRSGGGKAAAVHLDREARARGIEPIELRPGDDLVALVRDAVAGGADALAAAGGDGTQALVAAIAAEHDLPFACIPAGTRNHFALDLGVDRDDVVGALDAFVSGGERRVDLAEVNGRVFVNNVSLGVYAEAVHHPGYRDDKIRTLLDSVPEIAGPAPAAGHELRCRVDGTVPAGRAIVVQVSNNSYRLGRLVAAGTRPRIDDGRLGIALLLESQGPGRQRLSCRRREAAAFEVDADAPIAAGVDGEALTLDPPLRFVIRPRALRVRLAPQHPGASPSAGLPDGLIEAVRGLVRIVWSGEPGPTWSASGGAEPAGRLHRPERGPRAGAA